MIGDTHSDGTVVWTEEHLMGISKLPLVVGYNHKETYQTSGSFVAPITGLYRITLQGAGGGGGGAGVSGASVRYSGGGGGAGGHGVFYEQLTAGTSYTYTIGAGGTAGTAGSGSTTGGNGGNGGASSITIGNNVYNCTGGTGGNAGGNAGTGGYTGKFELNGTTVAYSVGASAGYTTTSNTGIIGGVGGLGLGSQTAGQNGAGGGGGSYYAIQGYFAGTAGGDGYITFEWFDPADAFPNLYPST